MLGFERRVGGESTMGSNWKRMKRVVGVVEGCAGSDWGVRLKRVWRGRYSASVLSRSDSGSCVTNSQRPPRPLPPGTMVSVG